MLCYIKIMGRRIKKKRLQKRKSGLKFNFFYVFFLVLLLTGVGAGTSIKSKSTSQPKVSNLTLTPTTSPTSSPTPTPTEVPLSGFCLNVPVLLYHHVQPYNEAALKKQSSLSVDNGQFDLQMGYLVSKGYTFLSAKELVDALTTHSALPPKSILITLDDGYRDAYTYAFPIFKKYNIKANLMIATGLVEGTDYLTWAQIEEMSRSGLIYFTDHTWSHYGVSGSNFEKIKFEIETAKQQLEQHTGQRIEIFTYPYGGSGSTAIKILQEDGFTGAFSTIPGVYQCDSFLLNLHRTRVGNTFLSFYGL